MFSIESSIVTLECSICTRDHVDNMFV